MIILLMTKTKNCNSNFTKVKVIDSFNPYQKFLSLELYLFTFVVDDHCDDDGGDDAWKTNQAMMSVADAF